MSKIVISISLSEYIRLFKFAQEIHANNAEPIPELNQANIPKIETALNQPFQTFDGVDLYKGFVHKAACLFYLIINNHVMNNGNKRMACMTLSYFCVKNTYLLNIPPKNLEKLAKEVASPHDHELMMNKLKNVIRKYIITLKRNGFRD